MRRLCRARGVWLSMDPKPAHPLILPGFSLITPNRKEAFELAGFADDTRHADPLAGRRAACGSPKISGATFKPALLLITLGEHGMLLCQRGQKPFHIPTLARKSSMFRRGRHCHRVLHAGHCGGRFAGRSRHLLQLRRRNRRRHAGVLRHFLLAGCDDLDGGVIGQFSRRGAGQIKAEASTFSILDILATPLPSLPWHEVHLAP